MIAKAAIQAQADTFRAWAAQWGQETIAGASELSFQLGRLARLSDQIAAGEEPDLTPPDKSEPETVDTAPDAEPPQAA